MKMTEKRKRSQNFTAEEKEKLVKLLLYHKNIIMNKKTDGSTNEAKNNAWMDITSTFNDSSSIYRNKESLMKVWEKLKSESKIYFTTTRSLTQTDGGTSTVKTDPVLEQVCAIMGRGTGITGVTDGDADFPEVTTKQEEEPQVEIEIEDISTPVTKKQKNTVSDEVVNTPLWPRRRPTASGPNERTEAVTNLCTSFQNVNKKKEDIEALRQQLLEDEIKFKTNLYQLQLEAASKDIDLKKLQIQSAARDVEIKEEVLNQIKNGGIALSNIFVPQKKD